MARGGLAAEDIRQSCWRRFGAPLCTERGVRTSCGARYRQPRTAPAAAYRNYGLIVPQDRRFLGVKPRLTQNESMRSTERAWDWPGRFLDVRGLEPNADENVHFLVRGQSPQADLQGDAALCIMANKR